MDQMLEINVVKVLERTNSIPFIGPSMQLKLRFLCADIYVTEGLFGQPGPIKYKY
jgi:hypothetical protein